MGLRGLRADCSTVYTVGLYCVKIAWRRIFKYLLEVAVVRVLPLVAVERT